MLRKKVFKLLLKKVNAVKIVLLTIMLCAFAFVCTEQVSAASYTESESNNYVGSADVVKLTGNDTFSGNLKDSDDVDFIKITLSQGSEINLDVYGSKPDYNGGYVTLYFYKASDTSDGFYYVIASYDWNLGYLHENEDLYLSSGTYYVRISNNAGDQKVNYKLTFKTTSVENFSEPNNYISQATNVVEGKKYTGIIESYDSYRRENDYDNDFFVINNSAKSNYYLIVKNINIGGNSNIFSVSTFNQSGEEVDLLGGDSYLWVAKNKTETISVSIPAGKTYFKVGSYGNSGKYEFTIVKKLSAPKSVNVNLYGHDDIKASWSAVNGATGYYVYYKKSSASSYSYLGKYSSTSAKIANLSDGAKYYVKVVPYKSTSAGTYKGTSKTSAPLYTLKKVSTPKVSRSGSKVKVKWNNIAGETGYQISKSTSKSGTSIVSTYKTTSGTYKTISAKKGKTYYYKVRAYKVVNGEKIYAPWSNVKSYKR